MMNSLKFSLILVAFALLFLLLVIVNVLYLAQRRRLHILKRLHAMKLAYQNFQLQSEVNVRESLIANASTEISDNIAVSLTLAKLSLITIDLDDGQKARESIDHVLNTINATIRDLHYLKQNCRGETISSVGLATALEIEADKIRALGKHTITISKSDEQQFLEPKVELELFRICQEALLNIMKHANATTIELNIGYRKKYVEISIEDDGVGFEFEDMKEQHFSKKSGIGMMKIRADLLQGELNFQKKLPTGTKVTITAPY